MFFLRRFSFILFLLSTTVVFADDAPNSEAFFEKRVRPILTARCGECHGEKKQEGGLRLDSRVDGLKGDSGPAIVPSKADESRLIQAIRWKSDDFKMPPKAQLPAEEIQTLTEWVQAGAFWPESAAASSSAAVTLATLPRLPDGSLDFLKSAPLHWAFRPVALPPIPAVKNVSACRTPIDRFITAELEQHNLRMSLEADRRTLIRRLSIDLLGLPPTYAETEQFVREKAPDAYEQLLDRLLASPSYGERWGRHWLDIARYADTKGYVFTENRFYPYSYGYRDYVVDAYNRDLPYDQFVMEQLAADRLDRHGNDASLAAMGFLTVGRRFLNNPHDIIDDRIDVVCRGVLGLTAACARCHDHKYDPIPQADYYSLYGIFNSSEEPGELPLIAAVPDTADGRAFTEGFQSREAKVQQFVSEHHRQYLQYQRDRLGDLLLAVLKRKGRAGEQNFAQGLPRDTLITRWTEYLDAGHQSQTPVFRPWHEFLSLPPEGFADRARERIAKFGESVEKRPIVNPLLRDAFAAAPPQNLADVAAIYTRLANESWGEWQTLQKEAADNKQPAPTQLPVAEREAIRQAFFGVQSPAGFPESQSQRLFERDTRDAMIKLRKEVDEWKVVAPGSPPRGMVLVDRPAPIDPVIFLRGDANRRGAPVPRRWPQILPERAEIKQGSGRLELARMIVSPQNPLTARVIVNRIWMQHFGRGLAAYPSDFGLRSEPPSHPELLDYLASRFVENGWSIKRIHREILLSQVYRQANIARGDGQAIDPENRWLWRMNRRRLEFEPYRDSLLAVAGRLDRMLGGKPINLDEQPASARRTVYAQVDRNNLPALFRTFDYPTPDASTAQRAETIVPQQSLFGLNAPFVQDLAIEIARTIVAQQSMQNSTNERLRLLFRQILARDPSPKELTATAEFLDPNPDRLWEVAQALLLTNEFAFVD